MSIVSLQPADGFAWIRIRREEKRNAMNAEARAELRAAMDDAEGKYPVVVVTGEANSFCAGVDLKEVRAFSEHGSDEPLAAWRALNLSIREHPAIFIAAVNGIALGGGATLIGMCDLAIAADDAQIGLPEIGFGMYANPAGPATQINITRKRAAWMLLTAERISGQTAAEWGLVNQAVPASELERTVAALATKIGRYDAAALTEAKRALDRIPLDVQTWQDAFDVGIETNANINEKSDNVDKALDHFRSGGRNPGQG